MSATIPPFVFEIYPTEVAALEALAGADRIRVPLRWAAERLRAVDVGAVTRLTMPQTWRLAWSVQEEIAEEIQSLVQQRGRHRLIVNMSEVAIADSGFVGMLVRVMRIVADAGGVLALCELTDQMAEMLQVCALPMCEHREE